MCIFNSELYYSIRGLSKKQFNVLCDVSLRLNDLRNCAIETTGCVKSSDGKHFRKVNYKSVISKVKKEFKGKFSGVQAHIAGATIKNHAESFNSYIALRNKKIDQEYDRPVNEPKKHGSLLLVQRRSWVRVILNCHLVGSIKKGWNQGIVDQRLTFRKT